MKGYDDTVIKRAQKTFLQNPFCWCGTTKTTNRITALFTPYSSTIGLAIYAVDG